MSNATPPTYRRSALSRAGATMGRHLSPFKKKVLALLLVVAGGGVALQAPGWVGGAPSARPQQVAPATETGPADLNAPGARGFVGRGQIPQSPPTSPAPTPTTTAEPNGTAADEASPWMSVAGQWLVTLGGSAAVGLILGLFFRSFLKTMAAVTAVGVAAVVALSYFQVIELDFSHMQQNYGAAAGWMGERAAGARDAVLRYLPIVAALAVGFVMGFLRK